MNANRSKGLKEITVKVVAKNIRGTVNVTDLMLQGGRTSTNWEGHLSEKRWHDN